MLIFSKFTYLDILKITKLNEYKINLLTKIKKHDNILVG